MSRSSYVPAVRGEYGMCYGITRIPKHTFVIKTKVGRRQIEERITYRQKRKLLFHSLSPYPLLPSKSHKMKFRTEVHRKTSYMLRATNISTVTTMMIFRNFEVM